METMTRTGERMETAGIPVKQVQPGTARMRDLTPAQRRAVLFAQQQGAAGACGEEGQG